ncbi:hypothetical protein QTP88_021910 [Uroleucon formosanum]
MLCNRECPSSGLHTYCTKDDERAFCGGLSGPGHRAATELPPQGFWSGRDDGARCTITRHCSRRSRRRTSCYSTAVTMACSGGSSPQDQKSGKLRTSLEISPFRRTTTTEMLPSSVEPARARTGKLETADRGTDGACRTRRWRQEEEELLEGKKLDGDGSSEKRDTNSRTPASVSSGSGSSPVNRGVAPHVELPVATSLLTPFSFTVTSVSSPEIVFGSVDTISGSDTKSGTRSSICNWLSRPVCPAAADEHRRRSRARAAAFPLDNINYIIMLSMVPRRWPISKLVLAHPDPFLRLLQERDRCMPYHFYPFPPSSSRPLASLASCVVVHLPKPSSTRTWPGHRGGQPRSLGIGPIASRSNSPSLVLSMSLVQCTYVYRHHSSSPEWTFPDDHLLSCQTSASLRVRPVSLSTVVYS